jgi:hypothetical protein
MIKKQDLNNMKLSIFGTLSFLLFSACIHNQRGNHSDFDFDNVVSSEIVRLDSINPNIVYSSISECMEDCEFEEELKAIQMSNDTLILSFTFEDTGCLDLYFCDYKTNYDTICIKTGNSKYLETDVNGNVTELASPCLCLYEIELRLANIDNQITALKVDNRIIK